MKKIKFSPYLLAKKIRRPDQITDDYWGVVDDNGYYVSDGTSCPLGTLLAGKRVYDRITTDAARLIGKPYEWVLGYIDGFDRARKTRKTSAYITGFETGRADRKLWRKELRGK